MKVLYTFFFILFSVVFAYGQTGYGGMKIKKKQGKYGLVDSQDKELIPIKYEDIRILNDTLFSVRLNGKYGLINRTKKEIVPLEYGYISGIYKNLILLVKYDSVIEKIEEYKLVNPSGKEIVTLPLDDEGLSKNSIGRYYENGQVVVKINGKYGLYNSQGEILPPQYDAIYIYYDPVVVKENDKYEIYNFKGEKITSIPYDYIYIENNSQALAETGEQSGYMDLDTGKFVPDKKAGEEIAFLKEIQEKKYEGVATARYSDEKQTFTHYIAKTLVYPMSAENNNVEGKVTLQFIVEKDGSVSNISFSGLLYGYGLEEEGIRVLKESEKWIPATIEGKPVRSYFHLPISFKLPR